MRLLRACCLWVTTAALTVISKTKPEEIWPVRVLHSDGEDAETVGFARDAIGWGSSEEEEVKRENVAGVPGAFVLTNVLREHECERLIALSEQAGFLDVDQARRFDPNAERLSGALHAAFDTTTVMDRCRSVLPSAIHSYATKKRDRDPGTSTAPFSRRCPGAPEGDYELSGISPRCRVYRYRPETNDVFRSHQDDVWPGCSLDGSSEKEFDSIVFDQWHYACDEKPWRFRPGEDRVSQLSMLLYLNDDFDGGETTFHHEDPRSQPTPVRPVTGSALCFFQNFRLGRSIRYDSALAHAHEGSPVRPRAEGQRPKYSIRTDVLYTFPTDAISR